MFYRIQKSMDVNDRIDYTSLQNRIPGERLRRDLPPRTYQFQFEELPTFGLYPRVRLFKAPLCPAWHMSANLQVEITHGELPDVNVLFGPIYVSEPVKAIIERIDPWKHQFWPVNVINEKGESVVTKQYYHMNMRRYIKMQEVPYGPEVDLGLDFDLDVAEKVYLPGIVLDRQVRELVELCPVWQGIKNTFNDTVLYFNEELFLALKNEGITGLDEYTRHGGEGEETVGHA
jgi:hypothetical protein